MALADEILDHRAPRRPVGDMEHRQARARNVDADERRRRGLLDSGMLVLAGQVAGEQDHAVDLAGADEARVVGLPRLGVARVADDQAVTRFRQHVFDGVEDRREERVGHAGQEGEHHLGRAHPEVPRAGVRRVAGLGDRLGDLRPGLLRHPLRAGDGAADRRRRHAGAPRDVEDRDAAADWSGAAVGMTRDMGTCLLDNAFVRPLTSFEVRLLSM